MIQRDKAYVSKTCDRICTQSACYTETIREQTSPVRIFTDIFKGAVYKYLYLKKTEG